MTLALAARAPNHLGDGVMALPALHALSRLGSLTIHAPAWGRDLYRDVEADVVPRGPIGPVDVAVLFAPSLRAAWEGRRASRRVGVPGDWRRWLLTDVVAAREHRRDTYAALATAAGAVVGGDPVYALHPDDAVPDVPSGHVGLNPLSASGATVEWAGFRALADHLGLPVVFYAGPGEAERLGAVAGAHPVQVGLPLPAFAGALSRCAVFVSNDSGGAHFARACGVPTVVIHGSTTAARTGPAGAIAIDGPELACRPCYRKACRNPDALACLRIPVDPVARVIADVIARKPRVG
jgi:ADP-heptose:LPS heptosyltransferase